MRYVGLLLFFICIPLLTGAIRLDPTIRRRAWMVLGLAPYVYGWAHLSVSIVSWAFWPGYVKGLLIALPDLLAIAFLLATPRRPIRRGVLIALGGYIVAAALSMATADLPFASFQYVWQLLRIFLVAAAVARISSGSDAPRHIVYGMCCGIAFQAFFSLTQHLHGVGQAIGTMRHKNLLGMMTHFVLLAALALILAGDRAFVLKVGVLSALVAVALTGSRGTVGFAGAGAVLLLLLSLIRRPTARKMRVVGSAAAILLAMAPLAYTTLATRFAKPSDTGTYDERAAFERAAKAMWADHLLGVGANEYVVVSNAKGYSARAGVASVFGSRSANVHNTYLLIAAETGWPGLITFVLLYVTALLTALRAAWARPYTRNSELLLGVALALGTVGVHNFYEWIFVVEPTQYLFAIMLGLAMGVGAGGTTRSQRSAVQHSRRQAELAVAP